MGNWHKYALVGCFVMGILNREVGEVELIPVAKGIIARWWIVLIAALLGTIAMWSQESDLATTPSLTEVVRVYESRDELAMLSLVGVDPSTVSPFPSFEHQILQIQQDSAIKKIADKLGFDVNVSVTRSEQRFSLLDTVEGDGKTKFTFLSVGTPTYTLWCSDSSVEHCNMALDVYLEELQSLRKTSIVSGIDRLQEMLSALPTKSQSVIDKIDGLNATKPLINGELALLSTTNTAVGATVSTVKTSTYIFGIAGGALVGILIALQLTLIDKRLRSRSQLLQHFESGDILGSVTANSISLQHVGAAIVARSGSNSIKSVALVPVDNQTLCTELAKGLHEVTSPLGISITALPSITDLAAKDLVSTEFGIIAVATQGVSIVSSITTTWSILASAQKTVLGVIITDSTN